MQTGKKAVHLHLPHKQSKGSIKYVGRSSALARCQGSVPSVVNYGVSSRSWEDRGHES